MSQLEALFERGLICEIVASFAFSIKCFVEHENPHCITYVSIVRCTLYIVHCTSYIVRCILNMLQW